MGSQFEPARTSESHTQCHRDVQPRTAALEGPRRDARDASSRTSRSHDGWRSRVRGRSRHFGRLGPRGCPRRPRRQERSRKRRRRGGIVDCLCRGSSHEVSWQALMISPVPAPPFERRILIHAHALNSPRIATLSKRSKIGASAARRQSLQQRESDTRQSVICRDIGRTADGPGGFERGSAPARAIMLRATQATPASNASK